METLTQIYSSRNILGLENYLTDKSEEKRKIVGKFLKSTSDLTQDPDPELKQYVSFYNTEQEDRYKEEKRRKTEGEKHFCYQLLCAYYLPLEEYITKFYTDSRFGFFHNNPFRYVANYWDDALTRVLVFHDRKDYFQEVFKASIHDSLKAGANAFIKNIHRRNASPESFQTNVRFETIRALHHFDLMPYDKMTYLGCLLHPDWGKLNSYESDWNNDFEEANLTQFLPTDAFALDTLYGIFEMEISISGVKWDRKYTLEAVFLKMMQKGLLDRTIIQEKILQALGNPSFKKSSFSWFTNMYKDIKYSNDENLNFQDKIMTLLSSDVGGIRKLALDICKKLHKNKAFHWQSFEQQLESAVSFEGKGNQKTILKIVAYRLNQNPNNREAILTDLTGIFINQDADIQNLASAIFEQKNLSEEIKTALEMYQDNMISEVQEQFFGSFETAVSPLEKYECNENYHPELPKEISTITTEEDYIYLLSEAIKSENVESRNMVLAQFANFQYLSTDKPDLLKPIKRQIDNKIKRWAYTDFDIFLHYWIFSKSEFSTLWNTWTPLVKRIKKVKNYTDWQNYIDFKPIQQELSKNGMPLLSENSRNINYTTLFERLKIYAEANIKPNLDDFSRAFNDARGETVTIIAKEIDNYLECDYIFCLCYRLNIHPKWRNFERYCKVIFEGSFYQSIIQNLGKTPILSIPSHEGLWIKAEVLVERLKVYQTEKIQPNNDDLNLAIKRVYLHETLPKVEGKEEYFKILEYLFSGQTIPKTRTAYWEEVWMTAMLRKHTNHPSIYYNYHKDKDWTTLEDFKLVSFYDGEFMRIKEVTTNENSWSVYPYQETYLKPYFSEVDFIQNINGYDPNNHLIEQIIKKPQALAYHGQFFLVDHLFHEKKESRHLALECFIQLIASHLLSKDIYVVITDLLTCHSKAVPMGRVVEFIIALKELQGVYYDVAQDILEQFFTKLQLEQIPRSSAKLFLLYGEILKETQQTLSQSVKEKLVNLKQVSALKKEIGKLLS